MKKIVIIFLFLVFNQVYSQTDYLSITANTLSSAVNMPRPQVYYPTPYVNLNLNLNTQDNNRKKPNYPIIFISGLVLTSSALLENYGNYKGFWSQTSRWGDYVTPTPSQIFLCIGTTFTLVGGIGMFCSK